MSDACSQSVLELLASLARREGHAAHPEPGGRLTRLLGADPRGSVARLSAQWFPPPREAALEDAGSLPLQNEALSEEEKYGAVLAWHVVRRRPWQALCDNTSTFYRYRRAAFAAFAARLCAELAAGPVPTSGALPQAPRLAGRARELQSVLDGLETAALVIEGQAGIGKTALAGAAVARCLAAAQSWDVPDAPVFSAVAWAAARDGDLTLPGLLDLLARALDYPGLLTRDPREQSRALREVLGRAPALLVIDDVDEAPRDVLRFALAVPSPSRVLLTARTRLDAAVRVLPVGPLPVDDTLALLRAQGKAQGLDALAESPESQLRPLAESVQGWPLLAVWSVGQIRQGQTLERVCARLQRAEGHVFEEMLGTTLARLSPPARAVLAAAAIFPAPASRAAIVSAALPAGQAAQAEAGLDELLAAALADARGGLGADERLYSLHPVTRQFAAEQLASAQDVRIAALHVRADPVLVLRALAFYAQLAREHGGPASNWRGYARLEREMSNMLALAGASAELREHALGRACAEQLIALGDGLRNLFRLRGYWREGLAFFHDVLDVAGGDARTRGWTMYRLAVLHYELGTRGYAETAEWARQAMDAFQASAPPDLRGMGHALRILGRAARERGRFDEAWRWLGEAEQLLSAHGQRGDLAIVRASQADLLRRQGRLEEAEALYRQVLPPSLAGEGTLRASPLADPATLANVLQHLGAIALRRGDLPGAESWFRHGQRSAAEAGSRAYEAECMWGLAQVARTRGDETRAEALAAAARELLSRVGRAHDRVAE